MRSISREILSSQSGKSNPDIEDSPATKISEKPMKEAISAAVLTELSCELSNEELGSAVRLIARLCETKRPISVRTAHIAAGMDKPSWLEISPAVLAFFEVTETEITLPTGADVSDDPEVEVLSSRRVQSELRIAVSPNRRPQVPQYATTEKPPNVSIRKAIWDQAIHLFSDAGMSEKTSRSVLAGMLKNFPEGDVAMAVSDASSQDALAEPHTWILGRLRADAKKRFTQTKNHGPKQSPHKLVTPELTGISQTKADKIRARNRGLTLKLEDL